MDKNNGWQSWTPTYTYKKPWWQRLMFWRKTPKVTGVYKQVGKTVYFKIPATHAEGSAPTFTLPIKPPKTEEDK